MKEGEPMRDEYNFSGASKNPYAAKLKKQISINIDVNTIDFFKRQAVASGIPYQTLINLYLTDCAINNRQLHTSWE
jgi:predicted DNA binding CopG/RHH family protein